MNTEIDYEESDLTAIEGWLLVCGVLRMAVAIPLGDILSDALDSLASIFLP